MKTFLTEYEQADGKYGDQVDALDWEHAQQLADQRGRGERVIGELKLTIWRDGMTHADADRICKALAESIDIDDEPMEEITP